MAPVATSITVRVQTVLYAHDTSQLRRWIAGVTRTVGLAPEVRSWTVSIGDCSPRPCLASDQVPAVVRSLQEAGAKAADYRFLGANLGHGGGQNALAEGCQDELLLILNPDCVASPWMLPRLIAALLADPGLAAVDARQLPLEHPKAYDPSSGITSWVSGACCLFRVVAYRQVGGFDARNFPLYADDVDLSWRIRLAGWRLRHVPAATTFHDKRLYPDGNPMASRAEAVTSAAAWLMLTHRYSQPAALNHWRAFLSSSGDPDFEQVVAEFGRREAQGDLPEPIDAEHRVAEFIGASFGRYRW